jgi:hypothetical protein
MIVRAHPPFALSEVEGFAPGHHPFALSEVEGFARAHHPFTLSEVEGPAQRMRLRLRSARTESKGTFASPERQWVR